MRCSYCGRETGTSTGYCEICGRRLQPVRRPAQNGTRRPAQGTAQRSAQRSVQGSAQRPVQRTANGKPVQKRPVAAARTGRPVQKKRKKTRWNPKFLAACAVILLLLILIPILIAACVHNRDDDLETRRIQMFYSGTAQKTSVVFAGKKYEKTIPGKIAETQCSADGKTQAVLTEAGALYYVTDVQLSPVASDVVGFVLSADGGKLAYTVEKAPETTDTSGTTDEASETETETEPQTTRQSSLLETTEESTTEYIPAGGEQYTEYAETSLFLYNGLDGASALIANHVEPTSVSLTPMGGGVCYTVASEAGDAFEGFCCRDGVSTSLGRNVLPVAVSEDGSLQYYVKYELLDSSWVLKFFRKGIENEVKLGEFSDGNKMSAWLNRDFSEIVFGLEGTRGGYYLCGADGEKQKISSGFSPVYVYGVREVRNGRSVIAPVDAFSKFVFTDNRGTAMYLDNKYNCTDTGADGTFFRLTPDLKKIYYLNENGELNACDLRKTDRTTIASNVLNFDLSADGSVLYYVNADDELHCRTGSKDKLAAEDVYTKGTGLCVTDNGYLYFLQNYAYGSGTLCYLKGNGGLHVLDEIKDVHDVAADSGEYIYYRANYGTISGTYDLYYGRGKKYTKLFDTMG